MISWTTNLPPLILASASPRRSELLRQLGVEFRIAPSDAVEIHDPAMPAERVAGINAYRKARSVAKKFPDALVMGADTLVFMERMLFGKPTSLQQAYLMLEQLQGRTHHVVTAVCLLHRRERRQRIFAEISAVTFQPLDSVKIRRYLTLVDPLDKAGAYAVQEETNLIISEVSGSYSNVVGLPLELLERQLSSWPDYK